MSKEDKPENQENDNDSESKVVIEEATKKAQGLIQTTIIPSVKTLIRFTPVGGSGFLFLSFLLQQQWALVLVTFPITVLAVIWAAYSESMLTTFSEVYKQRGKDDVNSLMTWIDKTDKAIKETIKWQLAGIEDKYLKLQGNTVKDFSTEGLKQSGFFVPLLNEVFVPLDLSGNFYRNFEGESLPLPPGFKWDKKTMELAEKEGLRIWDILKKPNKNSPFQRLVILAWGGYGKTTLLRHITYIYTNKKEKRYQAPKLLPVLLLLRKWQETIATEKDLDLATLIEKKHIPNLPESDGFQLPPNWAKNHLKNGTMLIMFDGFDEVKEEWRNDVSEWLGKQMNNYQNTIFILTSRPAGYKHFLTEYKLKAELYVKPFNRHQQEKFINDWYWCQEKYARGGRDMADVKLEAVTNASNLLQQLKNRPELDDLAKNPLLLNMITTLHRSYPGEELPRRRSELYREVVNLQLGNRPLARQIKLLLPADEAQQVLQKLALYMVQENKPNLDYNLLFKLVENPAKNFNKSIDVKEFVKQMVDVSELIVKRDEDYEFSHLSFQGYLAAKEIIDTRQDQLLIQNWDKAWWRETILLYCAQVNPNNLLRQLIKIGTKDAITLALRCIDETPRAIDADVETVLKNDADLETALKEIEIKVSNILFQNLENYLQNGEWRKADQETTQLMLQLGDKNEKGYLDKDDCLNFPKEELRIIDQLWVKYSDGKFGFSVQKQIWLDLGGKIGEYDRDTYRKFGDTIGWRKNGDWLNYSQLTFNTTALVGHLPALLAGNGETIVMGEEVELNGGVFVRTWANDEYISFLFSRL